MGDAKPSGFWLIPELVGLAQRLAEGYLQSELVINSSLIDCFCKEAKLGRKEIKSFPHLQTPLSSQLTCISSPRSC